MASLQVVQQVGKYLLALLRQASRHLSQDLNPIVNRDYRAIFDGFQNQLALRVDLSCFQAGYRGQGNHTAPYQAVVLALQQLEEIACEIRDQARVEVANFVQDFQAITLDMRIFIPEVECDFVDALLILGFRQYSGKLLIGDFVAPVLQVSNLIQS